MNDHNVARLEAKLEHLVESTFANLFGKRIRAHDIALHLARAMEDKVQINHEIDVRPLAPDQYSIYLNPQIRDLLLQKHHDLAEILGEHIVELAGRSGCRLSNTPLIKILANSDLDASGLIVKATHTNRPENSTALMQRVEIVPETAGPRNPQLLINGVHSFLLEDHIINVGREHDNHLTIDDPYISRHHLQLRLRFGAYTVFDSQSHGGTRINGVQIKEHRLQPGDVIQIGRTQIVYLEDETAGDATQVIEPIQPS